jgi:CheY-like chemotaxis protein
MKIIKNNSLNALVPIIAVTAYLLPGDKENYFQAGFDDFVAKPIFRENVISAMNRLSQKKELVIQEKFCSYAQLFKTILDQIKDLRRRMEITIHPVVITLSELPERNEIAVTEKAPQSLSDLSCLYLDFYQDAYIFFSKQLKDLKSIKFAQTSEEAASLLNTEKFDFIIIDINFNNEFIDMVSIDVLNKASRLANIPIIGVSASSAWDEDDKDLQEKFDAYIEKPLFKDKVVSVLNKFFFQKE